MELLDLSIWMSMAAAGIRLATPLIFAAMGGLISERSGVINIALEGLMIVGCFAAAWANLKTGSPYLALLFAMGVCGIFALLHAIPSVFWHANQVVSGMAINILAFGLTPLLSKAIFGSSASTPSIDEAHRFSDWTIPLLHKVPILGKIIGSQTPLVYLALLSVGLVHILLYRTKFGLRLRAVGAHPEAASTLGIRVRRLRVVAVMISGVFCGAGGTFLAIAHSTGFSKNMTSLRGYIALTALIFGKWRPKTTLFGCLLFGFMDAMQIRFQSFGLSIPPQFVQALPYILTIVILAGFVGQSNAPKALGKPYEP